MQPAARSAKHNGKERICNLSLKTRIPTDVAKCRIIRRLGGKGGGKRGRRDPYIGANHIRETERGDKRDNGARALNIVLQIPRVPRRLGKGGTEGGRKPKPNLPGDVTSSVRGIPRQGAGESRPRKSDISQKGYGREAFQSGID